MLLQKQKRTGRRLCGSGKQFGYSTVMPARVNHDCITTQIYLSGNLFVILSNNLGTATCVHLSAQADY
jgi:hypothetical protein